MEIKIVKNVVRCLLKSNKTNKENENFNEVKNIYIIFKFKYFMF